MDAAPQAPLLKALLASRPMAPLGPGLPSAEARERLADMSNEDLCGGPPVSEIHADCCRCGLWLAYGYLDESHTIAQGIETADGSYWHAIMHRREPDYDNSKYWFNRVGDHPIYRDLAASAKILAAGVPVAPDWMKRDSAWQPARFVDLVAEASQPGSPLLSLATGLQDAEWQLLFSHCWRAAVGVK